MERPGGLRIRHRTKRGPRILVLEDVRVPYQHEGVLVPLVCGDPRCVNPDSGERRIHRWKAYHLELDPEGFVIVAPEVWAKLSTLPDGGGFELVNHVPVPPPRSVIVPRVEGAAGVLIPGHGGGAGGEEVNTMGKLEGLSDEELRARSQKLSDDLEAKAAGVRAERLEIQAELDRRAQAERVERALAGLEPADREAARAALEG